MHPTVQGVADVLAIMDFGAIAVPMALSAPSAYRERIERDAQFRAVLNEGHVESRTPRPHPSAEAPTGSALLAYTSGTTGAPKGILHSHETLLASSESIIKAWEITAEDRLLHVLPLNHIHGLVVGVLGSLVASAAIKFLPKFDEQMVAQFASSASLFFGVPTMYHRLAKAGRVDALRGLRLAVSGSAPLALDLAQALTDAKIPLLERYGMTETCLTLSQPLAGERIPGTVGTAMPGVEFRIVAGELHVRTPALSSGILGRSGPLPGRDADGWFATGDLVAEGVGGIRIVGRRSNTIISGGFNVIPEAVEAVLSRHPSVVEVLVRGEVDDEFGQVVVADVVVQEATTSLDDLRTFATAELPPSQRPRRYVQVDALARNALGKLVRG